MYICVFNTMVNAVSIEVFNEVDGQSYGWCWDSDWQLLQPGTTLIIDVHRYGTVDSLDRFNNRSTDRLEGWKAENGAWWTCFIQAVTVERWTSELDGPRRSTGSTAWKRRRPVPLHWSALRVLALMLPLSRICRWRPCSCLHTCCSPHFTSPTLLNSTHLLQSACFCRLY